MTRRADGTPGLWLASAEPGRIPAWLQELAPDGQVRQEYHSDGRISFVSEGRFGSRDSVFVGGTDADLDGASVAIFDRDGVAGSAPASRAGFDCTSCPIGGPRDLLVFPRLCLTRQDALPEVADIWVEAGEGLTVATLHRREPQPVPGAPEHFQAHYLFDRTLALVHAEISREYQPLTPPSSDAPSSTTVTTRATMPSCSRCAASMAGAWSRCRRSRSATRPRSRRGSNARPTLPPAPHHPALHFGAIARTTPWPPACPPPRIPPAPAA